MKRLQKSTLLSIIGGITGTALVGALFFTLSVTTAAPTEAPPGGNPDFLIEGPPGPQGPQGNTGSTGAQGPQGPQGTVGNCRSRVAQCYSPAFGGCNVSIAVVSGYKMTGATCGTSIGPSGLFAWTTSANSTSISCNCHDFQQATSGYCRAYIWECES